MQRISQNWDLNQERYILDIPNSISVSSHKFSRSNSPSLSISESEEKLSASSSPPRPVLNNVYVKNPFKKGDCQEIRATSIRTLLEIDSLSEISSAAR